MLSEPAICVSEEEANHIIDGWCAAFHSEWSDPIGGVGDPDPTAHAAFVNYTKAVMMETRPFLMAFLDGARARILVGRGIFCFDLPGSRGKWIYLPDISNRLLVLPWKESEEVSQ
jgi:hypothetical protein